jgi:ketosteroid isomerase-like protein
VTEHPNAATARRSFEAWNSGRLHVFRETFSDDVVLHFGGNNAMSGPYRGQDAVMDALGRANRGTVGHHAELEALPAAVDAVLTVFRTEHQRSNAAAHP